MVSAADVMREINAALKTNALQLASSAPQQAVVPTGLMPFDMILNGGVPRGRMTEIYGSPSALKSYVGLCTIREAQRAGGIGALIDTERTFDAKWAAALGVDLDQLILWPTPDDDQEITGERALDTAEALLRTRQVDVLVFDSVAAALPQTYHNQRLAGESTQPGRLAAMMSLGLRKLTAANTNTAIIWINQLRTNIGVTFGNPEAPPGGKSLPFYASIRLNIKAVGKISKATKQHDGEKMIDGKIQVGQKYKIIVDKSKLFSPHKDTIFTWLYGRDCIDELSYAVSQGLEMGLVIQNGAMWEYDGLKVRGREKFYEALSEAPDVLDKLVTDVLNRHGIGNG